MNFILKVVQSHLFIFLYAVSAAFAQDYHLGSTNFRSSGDDVAQPYFEKGLLLLHNFEYEDAAEEFEMAQLLDPDFAMAYWGEAMCYNQTLWFHQDYEKGKGALYKLGVKAPERLEKAKTEEEKGFISSIELLYGDDQDIQTRNEKYEKSMAELYKKFPENEEVAAFYALALLGNSSGVENEEKYDAAAKVLMKLNAANPQHPGALNYMIHIYDDPATAYKGKKAASDYFVLATDSKYALHEPTHIFLATGDWDQTAKGNEASWKAAEAWVKKNKKSLEDRNYHALWWLEYAYLQQGKYKKAMELLSDMNRDARYSKSERMRFHLAMMRGHFAVESGNWTSEVMQTSIPAKGFNVSAKNMCFFVDAMAAIDRNDLPKVEWYLNQMTDQRMVEQSNGESFNDFRTYNTKPIIRTAGAEQELMLAEVMEWELKALVALKKNNTDEALRSVGKAAELEDKTEYEPGPPVVLKPSHELYGEILMAAGNNAAAVEQFDLALQRAPNRSLSLLGKYKALKNLGETAKANQVKALLMKNWKNADPEVLTLLN